MAPPLQPPEPPRFLPGAPIADVPAMFNSLIRDPFEFLLDPPRFRARRTTPLAVVENDVNFIDWDTIDEDNYAGWNSGIPSLYVAPAPGWYHVTAAASLSGTGAAGLIVIPMIATNAQSHTGFGPTGWEGPEVFVPTGGATQPKIVSGSWLVYAFAGDYIELNLYYSTESAITAVDTTPGLECRLEIVWDGL